MSASVDTLNPDRPISAARYLPGHLAVEVRVTRLLHRWLHPEHGAARHLPS